MVLDLLLSGLGLGELLHVCDGAAAGEPRVCERTVSHHLRFRGGFGVSDSTAAGKTMASSVSLRRASGDDRSLWYSFPAMR